MSTIDLTDPQQYAEAVASGVIWGAPKGDVLRAIDDINAGRLPRPDNIPSDVLPYIDPATDTGRDPSMPVG